MRKNCTYLNNKLNELYCIYENFAWSAKDRKIVVVFGKENIISFYLYDHSVCIDDFSISFDSQEFPLYNYLSLNLFIKMLGNVKIHKFSDYIYHNPYRKPYLLVAAKNEEIKKEIDSLIILQETTNLTPDLNQIKDIKKKILRPYIDNTFIEKLNKRIELSNTMLRSYHR